LIFSDLEEIGHYCIIICKMRSSSLCVHAVSKSTQTWNQTPIR